MLELKKEINFDVNDLEDVDVGLSETALNIIGYPIEEKQNPENVVDGQFSMPFCAALVLRNGSFTWDDYKSNLKNDDVLDLCKKVNVSPNKQAEECCPKYMSANVKIKVSGKVYEKFIKIPKGDPENFMTDQEFEDKFDGLTNPYLSEGKLNELKKFMLRIDNANSIKSLFELSN